MKNASINIWWTFQEFTPYGYAFWKYVPATQYLNLIIRLSSIIEIISSDSHKKYKLLKLEYWQKFSKSQTFITYFKIQVHKTLSMYIVYLKFGNLIQYFPYVFLYLSKYLKLGIGYSPVN